MTYEQIIRLYGTQQEAARLLDVSQPTLSRWRHNGIPWMRQLDIQHKTAGRLKAGESNG